MLKISMVREGKAATLLRLEGRLVGPWVSELEQLCKPLVNDSRKLSVDLADVTFADDNGVTLLARLRARGAKLLNAMPFVEEQLRSADLPA